MTDARVTGAARYAEDVDLDGQLHARLVRSPFPHARVIARRRELPSRRIASRCVPDDVRGLGRYGVQIEDETVLALDRVRYVGDVVAAVAAETPREAEEARRSRPGRLRGAAGRPRRGRGGRSGRAARPRRDRSRVRRRGVLRDAPPAGDERVPPLPAPPRRRRCRPGRRRTWSSRRRIGRPRRSTRAMEPHACVARWDGDRLEVFDGHADAVQPARGAGAHLRARARNECGSSCPPMGGSFGAKTFVRTEAIAAALARKAGRPVKLVLPRAEEWQTLNRHAAVVTMKLGALADGTLLALETTCLADTGAYADCGPGVAQKMGFAAPGPYRIPNVRVDARCVYTNLPPARRVSRLRPDAVGVGARAGGRPARGAARAGPARAASAQPPARRRRLLHRRDHARRPLRRVPGGGGATRSAGTRGGGGKA